MNEKKQILSFYHRFKVTVWDVLGFFIIYSYLHP